MNKRRRVPRGTAGVGQLIFAAPAADDVLALLRAWRFWFIGGLLGALIGALAYYVIPPSYRARATVNVDFHLEQAWPQNTDREQFYYLERETRKLMEIAFADATLMRVTERVPAVSIEELRAGKLQLSQPGNGGWHFFAEDMDPESAAELASSWAIAFSGEVKREIAARSVGGPEPFITADPVQVQHIHAERMHSQGAYMLAASGIALALIAFILLYFHVEK